MHLAGTVHGRPVKAGMSDDDAIPDHVVKLLVSLRERGCSGDRRLIDPMNRHIHGVKVVFRLDVGAKRADGHSISEERRTDLADARQARIRGLEIKRNEVHGPPPRGADHFLARRERRD